VLIDCFPYFNEKELLELRIETLYDHVDGFLITDANRTHRGEPKEFSCVNTLRELGIPEDKVQVLHVELPPIEEAPDPWIRERGQRDALSVGLFQLPEDTFFICSDCDEIANPEKLEEVKEAVLEHSDKTVRLSMSMHYGRADRQLESPTGEKFDWRCGTAGTVRQLKEFGTYIWDKPEVQKLCNEFDPEVGKTDMLGRQDHLITSYPVDKLPEAALRIERVRQYLLPDG